MNNHSYRKRWLVSAALALSLVACKSSEREGEDMDPAGGGQQQPGSGSDGGSGGSGGPSPTTPSSGGDAGRLDAAARDGGDSGAMRGGSQRRPMQACPAEVFFGSVPKNGDPCMSGRGACNIGSLTCDCPQDTLKWVCWDDSQCPSEAPPERASCPVVEMQCDYMAGQDELECECTANGWDCGRQVCPASEPMAGGACEGGDGVCAFGGRVCDCRSRAWVCWNASDCPTTPPALMATCPVERMVCTYPNDECQCRDDGWECDSHEEEEDEDEDGEEGAGAARDGGARSNDAGAATDGAVSQGDAARDAS